MATAGTLKDKGGFGDGLCQPLCDFGVLFLIIYIINISALLPAGSSERHTVQSHLIDRNPL